MKIFSYGRRCRDEKRMCVASQDFEHKVNAGGREGGLGQSLQKSHIPTFRIVGSEVGRGRFDV